MLPKQVKISGVNYLVVEVKEINDEPTNMGDILYHKAQIRIKEDMADDRKEQTLLHEVLHACLYEAGFSEQDEDMVNRLSNVLYQVLKENYLFKG